MSQDARCLIAHLSAFIKKNHALLRMIIRNISENPPKLSQRKAVGSQQVAVLAVFFGIIDLDIREVECKLEGIIVFLERDFV